MTLIPTTDIPEVILVEEDEFTEKIDKSTEILTNIQNVQLNLDEVVRENKVNESITGASFPRAETTQTESCTEDFDVQVIETKFDQPEVEIINAAETILTEEQSHTPRCSDDKEGDPTPPPPKMAFQEESSISKQPNEKTEDDINSMPNLGRRVL